MLHACAVKFDVTWNFEFFLVFGRNGLLLKSWTDPPRKKPLAASDLSTPKNHGARHVRDH